ncbi:hypothetical protein [Nonomuraea dietziae]|uniref:hypothetical protein n=1 Tax=Nonomuraea dietziae TaxID=65515 RepID=UPI003CD065D2
MTALRHRHRPLHRDPRGQRQDPHGGGRRLPRPPDLPAGPHEAIGSGVTTIVGGGTGPVEGTKATTVTGAWYLRHMLESLDSFPVNVALLGKGNTVSTEGPARTAAGRGLRLQAPRGLGHHARRDRRLPDGGGRDRRAV